MTPLPARVKLTWSARPEWDEWAAVSEGTYILRTNIHDWTDQELWKTYIQLSEAEAAFRIQKSDLCIRPIWHHKAERIKAHILVCFLAYAMWKTLQQWQSRAGLGDAPRTILTELSRINAADIVLPLADGFTKGIALALRGAPGSRTGDPAQHLGLTSAAAPAPATDRRNVVATRHLKSLIARIHLRTVEVGLGSGAHLRLGLTAPFYQFQICHHRVSPRLPSALRYGLFGKFVLSTRSASSRRSVIPSAS